MDRSLPQKRSMSCKLGAAANALSICRDNTKLVVAGRSFLKVFSIDENASRFEEKTKLHPIYTGGRKQGLNMSSSDVVWSPNEENLIATAATNGSVIVWDLMAASRNKQLHVFSAFQRTVTKVSFHPSESHKLLSGSQDGSMKMFDLRRNDCVSTYNSRADGVRNVQFSPFNHFQFAASFDNGNVQIWDYRRTNNVLLQSIAHKGSVNTLDWHPDPEEKNTLATGGRDNMVKIWDVAHSLKQKTDVPTTSSVASVTWRPNRREQLATSTLLVDFRINVWDLRRRFVPFASFEDYADNPTSIAWKHNDPSILFSCSKGGILFMHCVKEAFRPGDETETRGLDISSTGSVCVVDDTFNTGSPRPQSPSGQVPRSSLLPYLTSIAGVGDFDDYVTSSSSSVANNYKLSKFYKNQSCLKMISPKRIEPKRAKDMDDCLEPVDTVIEHMFMAGFQHAAKEYILDGNSSDRTFCEACEYNSQIALAAGMSNAARTWLLLAQFYPCASNSTVAFSTAANTNGTPLPRTFSDADKTKRNDAASKRPSLISKRDESHGSQLNNLGLSGAESEIHSEDGRMEMEDYLTDIAKGRHSEPDFYLSDDDAIQQFGYDGMTSEPDFLTDQEWATLSVPTEAIVQKEALDTDSISRFGHVDAPLAVVNQSVERRTIFTPHGGRWHATAVPHREVASNSPSPPADEDSQPLTDKDLVVKPSLWPDPLETIRDELICEQLKWFAEKNDVQTAVSIMLVLSSYSVLSEFPIDELVMEMWQLSYLNLLAKQQLWMTHEMVIKLSKVRSIRDVSSSSTVQVSCKICQRRMPTSKSWSCERRVEPDHGNRAASCFLCNLPVTGLYSYCQGCNFGGHFKCVELWLSRQKPIACQNHCV